MTARPETPFTGLSAEEMVAHRETVAASESAAKRNASSSVTVVVDGHELRCLDLRRQERFVCDLEAGAAFIEIRTKDSQGDVALATDFISYVTERSNSEKSVGWPGHGTIEFTVIPSGDVQADPSRGLATLAYRPAFGLRGVLGRRVLSVKRRRVCSGRPYSVGGCVDRMGGRWLLTGTKTSCSNSSLSRLSVIRRTRRHDRPGGRSLTRWFGTTRECVDRDIRHSRFVRSRYPPAVSLEFPLKENTEPYGYKVERRTFAGDEILMTEKKAKATSTDAGPAVEIVFSSMLLQPDTYYTVFLLWRSNRSLHIQSRGNGIGSMKAPSPLIATSNLQSDRATPGVARFGFRD